MIKSYLFSKMLKLKNKAQNSMEFVLLMSFMMLIFVIFFILVQGKLSSVYQEKNDAAAQQLENLIVNEIKLSETVHDNYYREFLLPTTLNSVSYNVSIMSGPGVSELVIKYVEKERVYFLETYVDRSSTIGIGMNNISKVNGKIYIRKMS